MLKKLIEHPTIGEKTNQLHNLEWDIFELLFTYLYEWAYYWIIHL